MCMRNVVIIVVICLILGCTANQAQRFDETLIKLKEQYQEKEHALNKFYFNLRDAIIVSFGGENIEKLLNSYNDYEVAEIVLMAYEKKMKYVFSSWTRQIILEGIAFPLRKIREDLKAKKDGGA